MLVGSSSTKQYAPKQERFNGQAYTINFPEAQGDEANLSFLQDAGWEYVCSHAAGGEPMAFVVVLRLDTE